MRQRGRPPNHSPEEIAVIVQRAEEIQNTPCRYVTEREVARAIEEEYGVSRKTLRRWVHGVHG